MRLHYCYLSALHCYDEEAFTIMMSVQGAGCSCALARASAHFFVWAFFSQTKIQITADTKGTCVYQSSIYTKLLRSCDHERLYFYFNNFHPLRDHQIPHQLQSPLVDSGSIISRSTRGAASISLHPECVIVMCLSLSL